MNGPVQRLNINIDISTDGESATPLRFDFSTKSDTTTPISWGPGQGVTVIIEVGDVVTPTWDDSSGLDHFLVRDHH